MTKEAEGHWQGFDCRVCCASPLRVVIRVSADIPCRSNTEIEHLHKRGNDMVG